MGARCGRICDSGALPERTATHRGLACRDAGIVRRPPMETQVPAPPDDPHELLSWAQEHQVAARLDDVLVGSDGPFGTFLPGRNGEVLTYRQILLERPATATRRERD